MLALMSLVGTLQPFAEEKLLVLTVRSWHKETFNAYGYVSNRGSGINKGIRHTPRAYWLQDSLPAINFRQKALGGGGGLLSGV